MPMSSRAPAPRAGSSIRCAGGRRDDEAEVGVHLPRRAELAGGQAARAARGPAGGRPSTSPPCRRGRPAAVEQLLAVGAVEGQRLLAEHGLAGREGQPGVLEVERVRAGDVDDVDVGVGHQRVVRRVGAGGVVAVRRGRSASADSRRARADGRDAGVRHGAEVRGEVAGDAARWRGCPSEWPCVVMPSQSDPATRRKRMTSL